MTENLQVDEYVINYGEAVKATRLEDGAGVRVGGYLVRYGGADLAGEHFEQDTDFDLDFPGRTTTYFHHGLDTQFGKKKLGKAELRADDFGIWAETILQERDEYEKFIAELALAGKLGWSSGTVSHLMERDGSKITRWPIAEASLTHTPAEPRNGVIPLKSLIPGTTQATDGVASLPVDENILSKTVLEVEKMELTAEQIEQMVSASAVKAVEEYRRTEPATVKAGVEIIKDEADQPFKTAGEFFQAVKNAALYPSRMDVRLMPLKANGMSEGVPADGGFLVQPQFASGLVERVYNTGQILSRVANDPLGPNSNSMVYNAVDETSRASSRFGGIIGYWMAEGGTKSATKPAFRQIELKLKKVAAAAYATDELLQDATALESWINRAVPEELRFKVEDAIYNGDGVGKPLGIMNAPALVSVTRVDASTVQLADVVAMWSRRWAGVNDYVWMINQDVMPKLMQLGSTYQFTWMPNTSLADAPFARLLGRPVIEVEYAATLGTTGDIMLASLSQYQTITKGGIQSASSIHVQFLTDETTFRFVFRIDGAPLWNSALTPFKGSNTQSPFVVLSTSS